MVAVLLCSVCEGDRERAGAAWRRAGGRRAAAAAAAATAPGSILPAWDGMGRRESAASQPASLTQDGARG